MPDAPFPGRLRLLLLAGLLTVIVLVYAPGLHGGFLFDDIVNLVKDDNWRLTEWTRAQVARAVSHGISSPSGRPLALLSFAANYYWFGANPYWLKAGNLLLHLINTLLLWLLAQRLIALARPASEAKLAALWVAAAWALHPLQVSTVLYTVQRMEVGAATGTLLALYAYIRARTVSDPPSREQVTWLGVAALAFVGGMLFKETTALACGFAFLIEAFFLKFRADGRRSIGWISLYALGLLGASLLTWYWLWPSTAGYAIRTFGLHERLLTQGPVLTMYLGQILAPLPDTFRFYYDDFPVSSDLLNPPFTGIAWALLAGLIALAYALRHRWPLTSFGLAWFFMAHALTSSFIPLELAFEHRNYLAILGILLALFEPMRALFNRFGPDVGKAAAPLALAGLALLTHANSLTWGNLATLHLTLELRAPNSQRASYALGNQMYVSANGDTQSPIWDMARRQWQHASTLPGDSILPLTALLIMDGQEGIEANSEKWERLQAALTRLPLRAYNRNGLQALVDCRVARQCVLDDQELWRTLALTIERNPRDVMLHMIFANYAWNGLNERALALHVQREAVALAPSDPSQQLALANYLIASGDTDLRAEAIELLETLRLADGDGGLSGALGQLHDMLFTTNSEELKSVGGH